MKKYLSTITVSCLLFFNTYNVYADISKQDITNVMSQVQISGAVKKPGVYSVPNGTRFVEVLKKAGGLKTEASLIGLNLASPVQDGIVLHIPTKKEQNLLPPVSKDFPNAQKIQLPTDFKNNAETGNPVNLNTATLEELISLPGIGEKTAQNIINYRNKNRGFRNINELKNIKRMSNKKIMKLKKLVTI